MVEADVKGFKPSISPELKVAAGQTVNFDFALTLAGATDTVNVSAANVENAYRVDNVDAGGPLGTTPILDLPYSVNVISRQLIDDTQSRNFKEAAKYLPLVSFQEMQGPEVLRPETRGMQGSNMQNDRKDGMGIAVTTPSALEEYEQIEVVNGLGGPLYGPANPSGMFNFVTKRPTEERFGEIELDYEGRSVGTIHTDLGGRFGKNRMFGYRTNLLLADGEGYVTGSQLRRQLAAGAGDVRLTNNTVIEGNFSYYNLFQHGYPGWFAYAPTTTPLSVPGSKSILLPPDAPDPTLRGYGQSFSGVDLTSQIGELRVKHDFSSNWHLVVGVLNQISDRNINTAVNQFIDNNGNYKSYLANSFLFAGPAFPRGQRPGVSDRQFQNREHSPRRRDRQHRLQVRVLLAGHQPCQDRAVHGATRNLPGQHLRSAGLCGTARRPLFLCEDQPIDRHLRVQHHPPAGLQLRRYHHAHSALAGAIGREPGLDLDRQLHGHRGHRLSENTSIPGGYVNQGVSPSASVMFKPRADMTIYATFADSIQAPDVAAANSGSIIIINASQALPPYRSKEGEIGYKLRVRRINFSTALFRVERPFANFVTGVVNPDLRRSVRHGELRGISGSRGTSSTMASRRRSPAGSFRA